MKFIAEIGSNHNNECFRAFELIKACKDAGFWGVKFQLFTYDTLFRQGYDSLTKEDRKKRELNFDFFSNDIISYCHKIGLKVGATPFNLEFAERLKRTDIDFYKISSFDILRHDLISLCNHDKKPLLVSTGLAEEDDILNLFAKFPLSNLVLLYCVSNYPSKLQHIHMKNIGIYRNYSQVGYSDHTAKESVIYSAVLANNAKYIETHVDLDDMQGFESSVGHCWKMKKIKKVIDTCKESVSVDTICDAISKEELNRRADPIDGLRPMR